jgi:hypothetical protein
MKTPDILLQEAAKLFAEKGEAYGHSYKNFGKVCAILFPDPVELKSENDFNRIGLITMIVHKMLRYTRQFNSGGHLDSIKDLQVYGAMLEELTAEGFCERAEKNHA